MQNNVLAKVSDPDLRVYVVWVPMSRGAERDVPKATREVPDARASHYWDGGFLTGKGYRETLQISEDAWDVFLLYGPEARWEGDHPPAPSYWMHQLGSPSRPRVNGPYLDTAIFLDRVKTLTRATSNSQLPKPAR
jgi:hypothetical protein